MPTSFLAFLQRGLVAALVVLLVLPVGEPFAFARKKKQRPTAASGSQLTPDQRASMRSIG